MIMRLLPALLVPLFSNCSNEESEKVSPQNAELCVNQSACEGNQAVPTPNPSVPKAFGFRDASRSFVLGETAPKSIPQKVNIGLKDQINNSAIVEKEGVAEIKTLYGVDRSIDWTHLAAIKAQTTSNPPKNPDIILQAFNMSYEYILENLPQIHEAGYSMIQISPPQRSLDKYGIWWEAYQPIDHRSFNSKYGREDELRQLIREAHARGIRVIADTILNHMADPLRLGVDDVLHYNDLYKPEHFINYDLFLDRLEFNFLAATSFIDEIDFFLSPERALSRRFDDFVAQQGLPRVSPYNLRSRRSLEALFVRQELPWLYYDLKRLAASKGTDIREINGNLYCSTDANEYQECRFNEAFAKSWTQLFGNSALIVRNYYFELTADSHPIYENEWDNSEKVLIKWYPGLPSLNTSHNFVIESHVDLLEKMLRLGIDGFRLDAVKHIPDTYFAELIERLGERLTADNQQVDGEWLTEKKLYVYGEMATSKVDIANAYRERMDITDFFLLDTFMYHTVFNDLVEEYGRGQLNVSVLRRSYLEDEIRSGDNRGWQKKLFPVVDDTEQSWFSLENFDRSIYLNSLKSPIYFARIHDSVVGDMFILKDYQQAMLGHAYFLTATDGRTLVYGSDEHVGINAGADYKEKMVLAALRFRRETSGEIYSDRYQSEDYCTSCNPEETLFVDRGSKGLSILHFGNKDLEIDAIHAKSLEMGSCYVELMSGRRFMVNSREQLERLGDTRITLPARSAAFILEADCRDDELIPGSDSSVKPPPSSNQPPVFLRTSFNNWSADDAYRFKPTMDSSCQSLETMMPAGTHALKIADEHYELDLGLEKSGTISLDSDTPLSLHSYAITGDRPANIELDLMAATRLSLIVCDIDAAPTLTVTIL
ncbi:alpha-amylase family glycosyl hydrolase [Pseudobacteriovorax antillogorgiicola]|nr:alpha-amylase family glycosyl hydrolase [Pseudobacteriovorax antillogorgiicola]